MFKSPSYAVASNFNATSVALGDLNGDGMDDLVVGHGVPQGISVSLATGGGSFGPFVSAFAPRRLGGVALGDFDGDGLRDVAMTSIATGSGSVFVGYGDGNGGWVDSFEVVASPGRMFEAAVGDLNGDGRDDLVFALLDSDSVMVYVSNANRTLTSTGRYFTYNSVNDVAIGDVVGSNAPDLVISIGDSAGIAIFPGNGDGTFGAPSDPLWPFFAQHVALGEIDGQPGLALVTAAPARTSPVD